MVTFPNSGMSDVNGSVRPSENVHLPPSTGDAPRFKVRKVSVNRQFPWMCGLEYQYFGVEPEETALVSGGETVPLNSDPINGAMTGSGLQNEAGTSTGLVVQGNAVQNLHLEATGSGKLVSNMFTIDAPVLNLDAPDFEMEIGAEAQSRELVGNELVDVMVESAVDVELPKEVLPSVEKLVLGEAEALPKITDEEGSALSSKKRISRKRVSFKLDSPKQCGSNATAPSAEDQNVGNESVDPRDGDNAVGSGPEVRAVSGGSKAGGSISPIKGSWRGKVVAKKTTRNANAQRIVVKKMAASSSQLPADTPSGKVVRYEGENSEDEAPCEKGSSLVEAGASSSNDDARFKVQDVLRTFRAVCEELVRGEVARLKEGKDRVKRIDIEASKILKERGKEVNTEHDHFIGAVPGVQVGDEFQYRVELVMVGIHHQYQGGIDYTTVGGQKIAVSIVASGGYDDDLGDPNVLIYSGHGGNGGKGRQPEDQKLERGNLALWNSKRLKNPVRVVRGTKEIDPRDESRMVNKYVYDGLYTVEDCQKVTGEHGKLVYMFKLRRNENQEEVAWNKFKASKKTARLTHDAVPFCVEDVSQEKRLVPISQKKTGRVTSYSGGVCIDDISQQKELVPIRVVNTVDDEKPPAFNYIKNVMYPKPFYLQDGSACSCSVNCSDSQNCSCAWKNGGKIPYKANGTIVETKAVVYECGPECKCPPSCYNRVSQKGIKRPLEVFKTDTRGWGVRALTSIPSGSFICEYAGEVINEEETKKRTNDEYLFELDLSLKYSDTEAGEKYTIDALEFGNVGRFVNHSCASNLFAQNVMYDHDDMKAPHIMLFAHENIPEMQELTCNYGYGLNQVRDSDGKIKVKECRCGVRGCTRRMY